MTAPSVLHQTPVFTAERQQSFWDPPLLVFAQENSKAIHDIHVFIIQFSLELLQNTKKYIHSNVFNNMCQNEVEDGFCPLQQLLLWFN